MKKTIFLFLLLMAWTVWGFDDATYSYDDWELYHYINLATHSDYCGWNLSLYGSDPSDYSYNVSTNYTVFYANGSIFHEEIPHQNCTGVYEEYTECDNNYTYGLDDVPCNATSECTVWLYNTSGGEETDAIQISELVDSMPACTTTTTTTTSTTTTFPGYEEINYDYPDWSLHHQLYLRSHDNYCFFYLDMYNPDNITTHYYYNLSMNYTLYYQNGSIIHDPIENTICVSIYHQYTFCTANMSYEVSTTPCNTTAECTVWMRNISNGEIVQISELVDTYTCAPSYENLPPSGIISTAGFPPKILGLSTDKFFNILALIVITAITLMIAYIDLRLGIVGGAASMNFIVFLTPFLSLPLTLIGMIDILVVLFWFGTSK